MSSDRVSNFNLGVVMEIVSRKHLFKEVSVVLRLDGTIQEMNHCPLDKGYQNILSLPVISYLSNIDSAHTL